MTHRVPENVGLAERLGRGGSLGGLVKPLRVWMAKMANAHNQLWLEGQATYDPPNLADGAGATTTVPLKGARLGDFAEASFSLNLQGILLGAWVSAADIVSVRFQNESGGALDLGSGTLRVAVRHTD